MWLPPTVFTAPTGAFITLAEARDVVRMPGDSSRDDELGRLLPLALSTVERLTGFRIDTQTVDLKASSFDDLDHLPIAPVQSISHVKYVDPAGVEQTIAAENYALFGAGAEWGIQASVGYSWPAVRAIRDAIRIRAVVGYAAAAQVPPELRIAVLLHLQGQFDGVPYDVTDMVTNYRIWL